ncbi:MAG: hypothetical protein COC23_06125, partial [Hyphomicrobiales bacterium]
GKPLRHRKTCRVWPREALKVKVYLRRDRCANICRLKIITPDVLPIHQQCWDIDGYGLSFRQPEGLLPD